jgi:hypothetical protein
MASGFVSVGTIDATTGEAVPQERDSENQMLHDIGTNSKKTLWGQQPITETPVGKNQSEWETVQKELREERSKREEERIKNMESGERSLYDILQANKGLCGSLTMFS